MHSWWRSFLFIWQCLIWTSISFMVCRYLFSFSTTQSPESHHDHKDTISLPKQQAQREQWTANPTQVNQELDLLVEDVLLQRTEHSAASLDESTAQEKYNELCNVYDTVCEMTSWQWTFWWTDKYLYQALWIALLNNLDDRLSTSNTVSETLSSLLVYQSKTDARGSAWHTNVKINNYSIPTLREYREVLTHELGHTVDLWVIRWTTNKKHTWFTEFDKVMRPIDDPSIPFYQISWLSESTRKREVWYKDFVSGYAMKWVYEDFAESHNLRINHNLLFQSLADKNDTIAKKYAYFKDLYNNDRFDDNADSAQTASISKRPRDTTRIR